MSLSLKVCLVTVDQYVGQQLTRKIFRDGVIVVPLTIIFNTSPSTGVFPDKWKVVHVVPIFKAGLRSNYRSISIPSSIAKLLELYVIRFLTDEVRVLLVDEQHTYLSGSLAVTNLVRRPS